MRRMDASDGMRHAGDLLGVDERRLGGIRTRPVSTRPGGAPELESASGHPRSVRAGLRVPPGIHPRGAIRYLTSCEFPAARMASGFRVASQNSGSVADESARHAPQYRFRPRKDPIFVSGWPVCVVSCRGSPLRHGAHPCARSRQHLHLPPAGVTYQRAQPDTLRRQSRHPASLDPLRGWRCRPCRAGGGDGSPRSAAPGQPSHASSHGAGPLARPMFSAM